MRLDIVTMTCGRDLELTKLQLKSFGKFLTNNVVNSITVIVNDVNAPVLKAQMQEFVSCVSFDTPLHILTYEEVVPAELVVDCRSERAQWRDWYSAQVARLYAANYLLDAEYQVILSSKDIFVNTIKIEDFFLNGKANVPALLPDPCDRILYHHWLACCELFAVDPLKYSPAQAYTPFVVNNDQMRRMIDSIASQGKSLATIFYETIDGRAGRVSYRPLFDLYLYSAWLHKNELFYEINNVGSIRSASMTNHFLQSASIFQIPPRFMKDNADCRESWVDQFRYVTVDYAKLINESEFIDLIESFK